MKRLNNFIFITLLLALVQCSNNTNSIDISNVKLKTLKAERVDQMMYEAKSGENLHKQLSKYPELYENFYSRMLRLGSEDELFDTTKTNNVIENLNLFLRDTTMQFIFKSIDEKFSQFEEYEEEISKGFARYNTLFEKNNKINLGTFYSNFNATVLETDQTIWIGLDMYLGKNNPVIKLLPNNALPQYYKDKMEEKYLVSDVFFGYLMSTVYYPLGDDFLSRMLSYGKIAYLMQLILPEQAEENKFRYSSDEIKWCKTNETYIWQYIIDNNLLYEKDPSKINVFFSDGPYTKQFGKESPSGIGIWLGYQMILNFAQNTDQGTLEIISEKNIQKLLSTYEPN
jgi:hypothetical protein